MNPVSEKSNVALLVCFAVREEAAFALPLPVLKGGRETIITGMGRRNASTRFGTALAQLSPDRVITCGFAGALDPKLKIGDVLFDEDFDTGFGDTLRTLGAVSARFYCSTRVAVTSAEKAALRRTTGADAVEMESSVIRTLCRDRGIPSATLRVISDTAHEDLPLDFNALMTSDQRISMLKLAASLLKSPRTVPRLLELQRNTRVAARRLADVLHGLMRVVERGGGVAPAGVAT
jgi:adenosylhomocysteine nucleosidase